jgi:parvulin-like peptidyl-prolyl isomerase
MLVLALLAPAFPRAQSAHRPTHDTLASIGKRVITSEQFARLFKDKLIRYGLTDNGEMRKGYLRNLVDDEVFIAEAKRRKLDRSHESRAELTRIKVQESLNAFAEHHIASSVAVTDDELKDLFVKMNTRIKVRHLFAAAKAEADSLYAELLGGASFDELAKRVFRDPQLREHGGSLGYITIDEMDPQFESAAYAMRVGEVSRPVKTVQGYSILRIDDIQHNPFVTESEFLKVKERLRGFARKRDYDQALAQFSALLRKRLGLRFNDQLMVRLFEMTRNQWPDASIERASIAFFPHDMTKTLVRSTSEAWTTSKAINALRKVPEAQRKWIRTQENLEDFIAGLIIRQHIVNMARKERLDATPAFRDRVEHAFDTYLLTTLERLLKKSIRPSQDSMQAYYVHNKESFGTPAEIRLSGILIDNAALADSIRHLLELALPFNLLAKQYSIQKGTAEYGGDLGFFRREKLGNLGTELFALRVGEWKGPFVQDGKYLLVKCTGLKESSYRSFDECKGDVEEMLVALAWGSARSQYAESFRKAMDYHVYPERLMTMSIN